MFKRRTTRSSGRTREPIVAASFAGYGRNYNMVRHQPKVMLGPTSYVLGMMGLALVAGLIYVTQGPRGTGYDYELQSVQTEVSRYESMRNDLALENARLTSVTQSGQSEVAANMVDAGTGKTISQ